MYRVTGRLIEEMLAEKEATAARLESRLTPRETEEARRDHHAHRPPIACGMTIHTGIGCNYGCLYCYVPDMGFPMKPRPYPLTGEQLAYALAVNPHFVPGQWGTLLAFGSVTEPFMPETRRRALEYLEATRRWLGNPQQVSTKTPLEGPDYEAFKKSAERNISVLVTIVTLRYARILEPAAPPPEKRYELIRRLSRDGYHVSLFLRPIIPGVTSEELDEILSRAAEAGARAVIPGSLRVTPGILRRLKAAGIPGYGEILRRLPRRPRNGRDQVVLHMSDLKRLAAEKARRYGLRVLPSSCSANIEAHGLACWVCRWGPCGEEKKLPKVDEEGLRDAFEALGCSAENISIDSSAIRVGLACRGSRARRAVLIVETVAKRRVIVERQPGARRG